MIAMRVRQVTCIAVLLATAVVAGAQTVQNGAIRINTRLVQINVVVREKSGPVPGLTKEDFTVLDNGKPQHIDVFSASDSRNRKQSSLGKMPPGVASNTINAAGEVPNTATVILFDMMNSSNDGGSQTDALGRQTNNVPVLGATTNNLTAINDQTDAIKQLVSYLRTIREGDRVALFVLGYQLHVIQDFTGDPDVLLRAAERIKALDQAGIEVSSQAQLASILEPPPVSNSDGSVTYVGTPGFSDSVVVLSAITRAISTADAFEAIARHMSGLPGRKNLVWMSAGFPFKPVVAQRRVGVQAQQAGETPDDFSSQLNRASKALNDANVAMYPVDYQGLRGSYPEVMMRLASATGGNVTYHTNDLKDAVSTAVADGDVSYTLGFYPADEKVDGKLHELKVKVDRKDVDLHYRGGYYSAPKAIPEKQRKDILSELLGGDVNSSQIGLIVSGEPDPATPGSYKVTISIDAANLDLTPKGDRRIGQLSLAMRLESSKSKNSQLGAIPLSFTEEQFQNVLKRGFVIRQSVQAGKKDRLRIVVQDQTTGLAGALWLSLSSQ
jgi:VWFA-related protein